MYFPNDHTSDENNLNKQLFYALSVNKFHYMDKIFKVYLNLRFEYEELYGLYEKDHTKGVLTNIKSEYNSDPSFSLVTENFIEYCETVLGQR